jgi:hypothetical protein
MYGGAAPAVSARDRTSEFSALVERLQVRFPAPVRPPRERLLAIDRSRNDDAIHPQPPPP